MIFKDKIADLVGSSDGYTDDQAKRYILDGCYDVYNKLKLLKRSEEVQKFGMWSDPAITNGTAIETDEIDEIIYVQRNGIPATKVSPNLVHEYTDVDSIHYASVNDPVYYFQEQYMTIKPAPAGGAEAYYIYIPTYSVTSYTSGTSSINRFPAEYYNHILQYAAVKILELIMQTYIQDEEDTELAQLMSAKIGLAKSEYNEMLQIEGK